MDIIHIISMGIAFALIGFVIGRLQGWLIDEQFKGLISNQKNEHIIVRLPVFYKWIGITGSIVMIGILLISIYFGSDTFNTWVGFGFGVSILMGAALIWVQQIWRVDIYRSEDYFLYFSSFGIKHKIKYSEIDYNIDGANYVKLKMPHKTYWIDNKAQNVGFLTLMLHEHKVKKLPTKKKWYE